MSKAKNAAAETAGQTVPEALAQQSSAIQPVRLLVAAPAGLNLREGPHKSYAVLAVLPEGSVVTVLDLPNDVEVPRWALVSSEAGTGWVADEFLLPEV